MNKLKFLVFIFSALSTLACSQSNMKAELFNESLNSDLVLDNQDPNPESPAITTTTIRNSIPTTTLPLATTTTIPGITTTTLPRATTTTTTVPGGNNNGDFELPGCSAGNLTVMELSRRWPDYNQNIRYQSFQGSILSLQFVNSGRPSDYGAFGPSGYPGDGGGTVTVSISKTRGCMDPSKLPAGCVDSGYMAGIRWSNEGYRARGICPLTSGETYYLNINHGEGFGRDWANMH